MRGLYAIADADFLASRGLDPMPFCRAVLEGGPALLQLRAKTASARRILEWLRELGPLCEAAGVPLVCNDRADLAMLSRCEGVHVGQDDLQVASVRQLAPSLIIGISTHSDVQLRDALGEGPDYVAFGPVFETHSKVRPDPVVGLSGLERARELLRGAVPLVAIGGIDLGRARQVGSVADVGAVISGLLPEEGLSGVPARVAALHEALSR